jgi:hypothetical protein
MSIRIDWKGPVIVALSVVVLSLAACGGSGGAAISHLTHRAFVSDNVDGTLHILDAQHDADSGVRITTGSQPGIMALSPDKSITLVFDAGTGSLAVVSNSQETVLGRITLPNLSTSYVSLVGNTVGFAAVSNSDVAPCTPHSGEGLPCVEVLDLFTSFIVTNTVNLDTTGQPLNAATTLVLSPLQNKLLVFGGPGEHVDTLTVIDTAAAQITPTPATAATQLGTTDCMNAMLPANCFDRPVFAVFSIDGTTAYILNCGPECGGTTASVTVLDMTQTPPVPTTTISKDANGASIGASTGLLLNGSLLYVAGSPPNAGCTCPPATICETPATAATSCGRLEIINTATNPPTLSTSGVVISDGYHNLMQLTSNNKLFIGAITCSAGCLTILDTGTNQPTVDGNSGNVTGIAPITGRDVVYVVEDVAAGSLDCQGQLPCLGKLRIYDATASVPTLTPTQIDIVGKAVDVKEIDQ